MPLEGTIRNGVVVLEPGSPTGMEPMIRKTPGVCGGSACVGRRRIAVWMLVEYRNLGAPDGEIMGQYDPPLGREELDEAWQHASANPDEIAQEIRENEEA